MEYVEVARAQSHRGEIVLRRRQDPDAPGAVTDLELRVNGVFVMDTLETTTETELARAALSQLTAPRSVLIGGLGLGFTLREVIADHRVEHVLVAEIEDSLVRWFRDGTIPHGRSFLADGRVTISVNDVQQVVEEAPDETFDLVLLDVDNGPDFLVYDSNAGIYETAFLDRVRRALRPGGVVAVWSSTRSSRLEEALTDVFGAARTERQPVVLQGHDEEFWLHVATAAT